MSKKNIFIVGGSLLEETNLSNNHYENSENNEYLVRQAIIKALEVNNDFNLYDYYGENFILKKSHDSNLEKISISQPHVCAADDIIILLYSYSNPSNFFKYISLTHNFILNRPFIGVCLDNTSLPLYRSRVF